MSIWKLFRPKPIFIITIPSNSHSWSYDLQSIKNDLVRQIGNDYHVIVKFDNTKKETEIKILK